MAVEEQSPAGHKIDLLLLPTFIATHVEQTGANQTTTSPNLLWRRRITASLSFIGIPRSDTG